MRPPVAQDAPAVAAVLAARDTVDLGAPDFTLEDLLDEWRLSEVDLSRDAIVAEGADRRIAGYAIVRSPGAFVVVDPAAEGQGIGTMLLGWAEGRERELGRDLHRQWVASRNERGRELLLAAGYKRQRSYWRMVRALENLGDPVAPPAGFALRPLHAEADAVALHAVDMAAFSALADFRPESLETFREEHLGAHDLDPELSRVAEHTGAIAGFLLARRWADERVGFVDILAVHPDHQRKGLGASLLRGAFERFAATGLREAQLGVASDNPRALGLYERVGMTARFEVEAYERPTSGSAG
jgi:mycothiol synthase